MSNPFDRQVGGDYYKNYKIQPGLFIETNGIGWMKGEAIQHVLRMGKKGDWANAVRDAEKAKDYIDKWLHLHAPCEACQPAAKPEPTVTDSTKWSGIMDRLGLHTERNTLGDLLKGCLLGGLEAEADELRALPSRVPGITNSLNLGAFLELMEGTDAKKEADA